MRKFAVEKKRIVKKRFVYDVQMHETIKKLLFDYDKRINPNSVRGYVVASKRGHAYTRQSEFSVPEWAYNKSSGYFVYYVAHELSHIIGYRKFRSHGHDREFYDVFKRICPKDLQYHEIGYLKKNAHDNGIWEK